MTSVQVTSGIARANENGTSFQRHEVISGEGRRTFPFWSPPALIVPISLQAARESFSSMGGIAFNAFTFRRADSCLARRQPWPDWKSRNRWFG
jgi:hypothetical protein